MMNLQIPTWSLTTCWV